MIHLLTLKNFKTFRVGTIRFGPVSFVLGANGSGKSNLFDALRFLKAVGDGRSVRDAIEGHASPSAASTAVSGVRGGGAAATHLLSGSNEFELETTLKAEGDTITYALRVDVSTYRVVHEELRSKKHPGPYVYSTRPETGALEQDPESPVVVARFHKGTRGINPRRDFSPYNFILSQFTSRRAESRINEDVAQMVRDEFSSIQLLELRPEILRQYSSLGRDELGEHGENFAAVVWKLKDDATRRRLVRGRDDDGELTVRTVEGDKESRRRLKSITAWLTELTPISIEAIDTVRAPTGEVIFAVKEEGYDQPIAAPSLSDGTLRFAALALAAVGAGGRQTLVIEELENGISPARLSLLVKMLEQTADTNGEVQVIASTHSPAVLDYASKETIQQSVIFGWNYEQMCSRPLPISAIPRLKEVMSDRTLGDLQAEGWLQLAADA